MHNFFFGHKRILERTTKEFYLFSRWIPAIMIWTVFNGAISTTKIKEGGGLNLYI